MAASTTNDEPYIRHATREDVPQILSLIRELADYEHELSSVEATESSLLQTLSFALSPNTHAQPRSSSLTPAQRSSAAEILEPISPERTARTLLVFPSRDRPAAIGLALYYHTYSTWTSKPGIYLEDLFVRPAGRGKGYGKALLRRLAQLVREIDGGRLEWSVLKWNKPSIDFYLSEAIGAKDMTEWSGMRVDGAALTNLAGGSKTS